MLLPEVAVQLIMQDLTQDREAAIGTLQLSIKYGDSHFVLDPDDEVGYDLSIMKACRNIRRAEAADSNTNEDHSSTYRLKKRLRRKRTTPNEVSVVFDSDGEPIGEDVDGDHHRKRQRITSDRGN